MFNPLVNSTSCLYRSHTLKRIMFETNPNKRKEMPICSGVLDYFPLALAEVAKASKAGNDQHNPGQPLFWNRTKSTDHADCLLRHLVERGTTDTDGVPHSAKVAWRALAILQLEMEQNEELSIVKQNEYPAGGMAAPGKLFHCAYTVGPDGSVRGTSNAPSSTGGTGSNGDQQNHHLTLDEVMAQWQQRHEMEEAMREEVPSGWKANPGYLPVASNTMVEVLHRASVWGKTMGAAFLYDWDILGDESDILEYRVIGVQAGGAV
jgi:hypothetical protein